MRGFSQRINALGYIIWGCTIINNSYYFNETLVKNFVGQHQGL